MANETASLVIKVTPDGVQRASDQLRELTNQGRTTERQFDSVSESSRRLTGAIRGVTQAFALFGVGLGALELVKTADEFKLVEARIRLVTSSQKELADVQEQLFQISQKTRTEFSQTANLFTAVARVSDETNERVLALAETIQMAGVVSGGDQASLAAGITQLTQALGSGVLRGEEFNSVMENTPRIAQAIAAALGKTTGELRSMAAEGLLTSDVVFEALLSQSENIRKEFEQMPLTVGQATQVLRNEFGLFVSQADQTLGVTERLAQGIVLLSENLDTLATAGGAVALVFGGRVAASLALSAKEMVASTAASVAKARATVQLTENNLRAAIAEQAMARTVAINTGNMAVQRQAALNLAAAHKAHAAALAEASLAARASTVAMTNLSRVMAFFGGPVGLAITGIGAAIWYLSSRTSDANSAQVEYNEALEQADRFMESVSGNAATMAENYKKEAEAALEAAKQTLELQKARIQARIASASVRSDDPLDRFATASAGMTDTQAERARQQALAGYEAQLKQVEDQISALNEKTRELGEVTVDTTTKVKTVTSELDDELLKQYEKLTQQLERQIALHGQTGEAAKIRYEIERGALQGLNEEQQRRLEALAEELDAKERAAENKRLTDRLREQLMTEEEMVIESYRRRDQLIMEMLELGSEEQLELLSRNAERMHEELRLIQEKNLSAEQKLWEASWTGRAKVVGGIMGQLSNLMNSTSRGMFEIGKAAAISETVIATYTSATQAYKALAGIPVVGPSLAAAAAAAAVASGLANVQRIKSTNFGQGGGASPSIPSSVSGNPAGTPGGPPVEAMQPGAGTERGSQGQTFIFYGDFYGNDAEKLFYEFKSLISDGDHVLIESTSRNAQELNSL